MALSWDRPNGGYIYLRGEVVTSFYVTGPSFPSARAGRKNGGTGRRAKMSPEKLSRNEQCDSCTMLVAVV
jgi:hypothetical protein